MIDHIVFDIDGTLTDGSIIISDNGGESKRFQAKDGLIVRALPQLGFTTIIMTGRNSEAAQIRSEDLHISVFFHGVVDKAMVLQTYLKEHKLQHKRFAYIGDDLNDYEAMKQCAFKACPADATKEIRMLCDYVSPLPAGYGAVRDICEYLLRRQDQYAAFLKLFGLESVLR